MIKKCFEKYLILLAFCSIGNLFSADVTYSSGTTLTGDLRLSLSQRAIVNATATIDGAGYLYQFPVTPDPVLLVNAGFVATFQNILMKDFSDSNLSLATGSSIIFGNNSAVSLIFDQALTNTLRFSGANSYLIGNGKTLDLGLGKISVLAGGKLTISDLNIANISSKNFGCVDNTGSIVFKNVTINVTDRFNWGLGSFSVLQNLDLVGGTFVYSSGMTSTVNSNSFLNFSNNLTFSHDPVILAGQSVAKNQSLTFSDSSSWLVLDNSSLYVTTTGLALMKGSLEVVGNNYCYSDATGTNTSQMLTLGDGISYSNDFVLKKFDSSSANIFIQKGKLVYQNVEIPPTPSTPTLVPIKYGDGLVLKNKKYGFYLYSSNFNWSNTGRVLGGSNTLSDKTTWVTANDNVNAPWADAGSNIVSYANFAGGPADSYILVNKNYAASDFLGICSSASGVDASKVTASSKFTLAFTDNINTETTRRTVSFFKSSHPVAQQETGGQAYNAASAPLDQSLNVGDDICIMSNGSGGRGMWLTGTNQTFVENSETINEVSWFLGTGGDGSSTISGTPFDGSHVWTIVSRESSAYSSLPSVLT